MDTLAFGYILPTTGRIPDLHRLETCAAGRTRNNKRSRFFLLRLLFIQSVLVVALIRSDKLTRGHPLVIALCLD